MKTIALSALMFLGATGTSAEEWTLKQCIDPALELNISLKQLNTQTLPDGGGVLFTMTFEVNNVGQLDTIIGSIRKVEGIIDVTREK